MQVDYWEALALLTKLRDEEKISKESFQILLDEMVDRVEARVNKAFKI